MNIYLIKLKHCTYEEFDSWVVQATTEEEAIIVVKCNKTKEEAEQTYYNNQYRENIKLIKLIGNNNETESKIILGSYNAG